MVIYGETIEIAEWENINYNGIPVRAIYIGPELSMLSATDICKFYGKRIDRFMRSVAGMSIGKTDKYTSRGRYGGTFFSVPMCDMLINWCTEMPINKFERFEVSFFKGLESILSGMHRICKFDMILQYKVKQYRIDCYIPIAKLAIEYDEKQHNSTKEEDAKREEDIIDYLHGDIYFIRVDIGDEYNGYAKIIEYILYSFLPGQSEMYLNSSTLYLTE